MNWKLIVTIALAATLGTVGAHTYFNGFNFELTLLTGLAAFSGAAFLGYVSTLGKKK